MHRELDSRITPEGDVIGLWWDDETDVVLLVIEPAEGERCSVPVASERARDLGPGASPARPAPSRMAMQGRRLSPPEEAR